MNALWEIAVPLIRSHGGHANKFLGDGLLAVFNAPRPCADHAQCAVDAATAIVAAVAERFQGDVEVGVGIHTGPVMAGRIGGGGRVEFTVIGDVVNTASRIESATRITGDTILISEATWGQLRDQDGYLTRPGVTLKYKLAPVALHAPASSVRV